MADPRQNPEDHPQAVLMRIQRRLADDLTNIGDPVATFEAFEKDVEELRTALKPFQNTHPLLGGLADVLQLCVKTGGKMSQELRAFRQERDRAELQSSSEPDADED